MNEDEKIKMVVKKRGAKRGKEKDTKDFVKKRRNKRILHMKELKTEELNMKVLNMKELGIRELNMKVLNMKEFPANMGENKRTKQVIKKPKTVTEMGKEKEIKEFVKERRTKMGLHLMEHPKFKQLHSKSEPEGKRARVTVKKQDTEKTEQLPADRLGDSISGQTRACAGPKAA